MQSKSKKIFINKTVELERGDDGFYRDESGTIYALPDNASSIDDITRCGIGILSLPENWRINQACKTHDYMYSSPVYQAFHTRKEADEVLRKHLANMGYPVIGSLFKKVASIFGGRFWENKRTI